MGKYDPLTRWLERQQGNRATTTLDDIEDEDRIGVKLPRAAMEYREWWANEVDPKTRHVQCRAWLKAGWKVESVDIAKGVVVFVRQK